MNYTIRRCKRFALGGCVWVGGRVNQGVILVRMCAKHVLVLYLLFVVS